MSKGEQMVEIRLVDLELVKRYSLALRQETAPATELLQLLDDARRHVEQAIGGGQAGDGGGERGRRRRPAGSA